MSIMCAAHKTKEEEHDYDSQKQISKTSRRERYWSDILIRKAYKSWGYE